MSYFYFLKLFSQKKIIILLFLKNFNLFLEKKITSNNGIHNIYRFKRTIPIFFKFKVFNFSKKKNRNKDIRKKNNLRSQKPSSLKTNKIIVFRHNNLYLLKFLIQLEYI